MFKLFAMHVYEIERGCKRTSKCVRRA